MMVLKFFENIGLAVKDWWQISRNFLSLLYQTLYWIVLGPGKQRPVKRPAVFEQMVFMGTKSVVIVFFVTLFTGIVLAMQSAHQLSKMGATIYVASLVSISICLEL